MATSSTEVVRTNIPARMDRLPWSRWHWMVVFALGITWLLGYGARSRTRRGGVILWVMEPIAERPFIAHPEYGVPKDTKGLLKWSSVAERFALEPNFWICTSSPEGIPHIRPTWGVFVDNTICFGGGPETKWSRNLRTNAHVTVHLESGSEVVIAEGTVDRLTDADDPRLKAIDDAYETKYKMRHGPPIWLLAPDLVFAWASFPKDMTRFRF